jgi:enoyl-CoA hydratase
MDYETIKTEVEGATFIVTLNRPDKLNALSNKLREEVVSALQPVASNPDIRAIIITGGEKVFAAGADLNNLGEANTVTIFGSGIGNMFETVANMPQPTIAAVSGYAFGGGCELSMACDFRLASETAQFGQPEIKVGLIPGAGGTQRLARLVGTTKAKELVFIGDPIDAQEAYRLGLVNKVVPVDQLMDEAKKWASKLASRPPFSLRMAKVSMDKGYDLGIDAALAMERLAFTAIFGTEDRLEGIKAFLEKRKPDFKGK